MLLLLLGLPCEAVVLCFRLQVWDVVQGVFASTEAAICAGKWIEGIVRARVQDGCGCPRVRLVAKLGAPCSKDNCLSLTPPPTPYPYPMWGMGGTKGGQ